MCPKLRTVITHLIEQEGIRAFYSGWLTNMLRILPHYCFVFVFYEKFSHLLAKYLD